MAYYVNASTANNNPKRYHDRVIFHCFGARGQPQVYVLSKAEQAKQLKEQAAKST